MGEGKLEVGSPVEVRWRCKVLVKLDSTTILTTTLRVALDEAVKSFGLLRGGFGWGMFVYPSKKIRRSWK